MNLCNTPQIIIKIRYCQTGICEYMTCLYEVNYRESGCGSFRWHHFLLSVHFLFQRFVLPQQSSKNNCVYISVAKAHAPPKFWTQNSVRLDKILKFGSTMISTLLERIFAYSSDLLLLSVQNTILLFQVKTRYDHLFISRSK